MRKFFLGVGFDTLSLEDAAEAVTEHEALDAFGYVVTPNVDHVLNLHEECDDGVFRAAYRGAMLVLNDSRILEGLAWLVGRELRATPGSDLTEAVLARLDRHGSRAAIVGGCGEVIDALRRRYPQIELTTFFPPRGLRHDGASRLEVVQFMEGTPVPVYFLAVGAPQSEMICQTVAERGRAKGVALCIGSGIEFASGLKARAPRWMQRLRLEWLFRLTQEPRRLAGRYLIRGPRILWVWLRFGRSARLL